MEVESENHTKMIILIFNTQNHKNPKEFIRIKKSRYKNHVKKSYKKRNQGKSIFKVSLMTVTLFTPY